MTHETRPSPSFYSSNPVWSPNRSGAAPDPAALGGGGLANAGRWRWEAAGGATAGAGPVAARPWLHIGRAGSPQLLASRLAAPGRRQLGGGRRPCAWAALCLRAVLDAAAVTQGPVGVLCTLKDRGRCWTLARGCQLSGWFVIYGVRNNKYMCYIYFLNKHVLYILSVGDLELINIIQWHLRKYSTILL